MSLHFKNPRMLLGWSSLGTHSSTWIRLRIAEGDDQPIDFDPHNYDVEVILTPKFKPGWYAYKSSNNSYEVRFFEDDPETMFGRGTWHKTTEPVEAEK